MSGALEILLVAAAVLLIAFRLFRAQRINGGGRWWLMPVVLAVVALREPGLVDHAHPYAAGTLMVLNVLTGLLTGAAWAWTSRVWREADGSLWAAGSKAAGAVWCGGILVRVALYGVGASLGITQHTPVLLLGLAATFLARGLLLNHRAALLGPTYGDGSGAPQSARRNNRAPRPKDRV
ncbi:DUF1453 domain-containing protein [Streptomyces sp. SID11233]|uniref:DUF1453 domain-containing protein n=1 Tax=Streptomyces sp. SID11385 TaxID=2706031 RepID=UPI0013BF4D11|nr:DUF1453 domain-containing protein [Streptomyces sp. SID11385]NEA42976.1 DUF1453 domain-containing protein [Streptomyces sp. SID11385]NED88042.1 DUF1453 domain-containing protein [Streptomyces sp. SID11233]